MEVQKGYMTCLRSHRQSINSNLNSETVSSFHSEVQVFRIFKGLPRGAGCLTGKRRRRKKKSHLAKESCLAMNKVRGFFLLTISKAR